MVLWYMGVELWALCMLGKHPTTELHLQPWHWSRSSADHWSSFIYKMRELDHNNWKSRSWERQLLNSWQSLEWLKQYFLIFSLFQLIFSTYNIFVIVHAFINMLMDTRIWILTKPVEWYSLFSCYCLCSS